MVTEIILIICIPITLFIGCYFTLEAYKLGAKVNEKKKEEEKVEENFEPVEVSEEQQAKFQEVLNEYLYG